MYTNSNAYDSDALIVSTINPLFWKETGNIRQVGTTTRQVDLAIQLLFNGCLVVVLDAYDQGSNKMANKELFARIIKRLKSEHRHVADMHLSMDKTNLTLYLNKNKKTS